jgi:hypothetical protein
MTALLGLVAVKRILCLPGPVREAGAGNYGAGVRGTQHLLGEGQ